MHGAPSWSYPYRHMIRRVAAAGFRVIAPVLPFYTIELKKSDFKGQMTYLLDFLDHIGLRSGIVVGNSLGGQMAVELVHQQPEFARGLVLTGASGIFEVDLGSSVMRRRDREYLRERVTKTFYDPSFCTESILDDVVEVLNDREKVVRLIRLARSLQQTSVKELLGNILVPTRLIWGEQDQITPPDVAASFQEGIVGSELMFIDRCGHAPMLERPGEFNQLLLSFLVEQYATEYDVTTDS